ncbi:PAS-domain containing protein [Pyruvatibacter mobilis]|uniref:sensor histidine kinase n=1 Tax=Pyruvatibacter mobilis TaxID=1712261 RepID=UPI003C7B567A
MPVGTREGTDALIAGLDSLRVGIIVFNGDDRLTYSNAHFRYIFRTFDDLDAIVGLTFEDILRRLLSEGEIAGTRAINDPEGWIADTLAFHRSRDWTPRIERLSDGRWMEVKSRPLDDGGAIVHWNDVTSLMRVQMRFEAAIESTADGFAVWDQADRLVLHNRVFARLHRVAGDQLEPGITFRDFMTRTSESDVFHTGGDAAQWLNRRMEKHALPVGQSTLRHVDGRWFLMRDRHTREGGRVTVYTDITELKERERQLIERGRTLQSTVHELEMNRAMLENQASSLVDVAEKLDYEKEAAERANESKTSFLRNMSHELRTPLNSIIGFSEVLEQELFGRLGNERYLDYAKMIHTSGDHLLTLINQILDLSKIEAGRYELVHRHFDLREVVEDCTDILSTQARAGNISIDLSLPDEELEIEADHTAIRQSVLNLMSNAIKFTTEGGSVTVRLEQEDEMARITVADTGIGIAPNDIKRVLIPFEQVESSMSVGAQGTGLGLPIVKSLVQLHGGQLNLASTLGKGTTVTIWLPIEACDVPEAGMVGQRPFGLIASPKG